MAKIELLFKEPDGKSSAGSAWVVPGGFSDKEGSLLTPQCASFGEFSAQIDSLIGELEAVRAAGRKAFERARSTPLRDDFPKSNY